MGPFAVACLLLSLCSSVAVARRSPNAGFIDEMMRIPELAPLTRFSSDVFEDARLDVPDLIRKYDYPCEVHSVVTADGYILELQRIPRGRDRNTQPGVRTPVLMMHGLLSSSADYVIKGPGNALGYLLAEEGYDVWLGNARGNFYSRNHTYLDPNDRQNQAFWRFSWDEIGNYDLPAYIDYILQVTGQPKLHYVGHSQGGTAFLVFASLRPEYNEKIISFQGLAPASFFINNDFRLFEVLAPYTNLLEPLAFRLGFGEILGRSNFFRWVGANICADGTNTQPICLGFPIIGAYLSAVNTTMLPAFLGHAPAGAAIRQIAHYGQNINDGTFRRYSYGLAGNLAEYAQFNPPSYNLSLITAPVYLHYALADEWVHPKDVLHLAERLSNVRVIQVEREDFGHLDFIWGRDVFEMVNGKVLRSLRLADAA